jgi:hypothetical protein
MKARFLAYAVVAAGLAGCATDYVPPPPVNIPGPEYSDRQVRPDLGPGIFGDLRWNINFSGTEKKTTRLSVTEQEEFKKWQESISPSERQEFEDWRAWQEWKRKNPK